MNAISQTHVADAPLSSLPPIPATAPTFAKLLHRALESMFVIDGVATTDLWIECCNALASLPTTGSPTRHVGNDLYWLAEDGTLVPEAVVKTTDKLKDDFVRSVAVAALQLNGSLGRFKASSMAEGHALVELLASAHGIELGGTKGNVLFYSFDREWQVELAKADRVSFGAEIQAARTALEQWVRETEGAPELKVVINRAFGLDQAGALRPAELFRLMSYEMPGQTWAKAMDALRASIQVIGRSEYLRVRRRRADGKYELIALDLASV